MVFDDMKFSGLIMRTAYFDDLQIIRDVHHKLIPKKH